MRKKKKGFEGAIPSVENFAGQPESCFELINKYGTYNIQPTADSDNPYPAIAQGIPRHLAQDTQKRHEPS